MCVPTILTALAVVLATGASHAQVPAWQAKMEGERRDAAAGNVSVFSITSRSGLDPSWAPGVHVYYNAPRPFCYAYVYPGEWVTLRSRPGVRSKDGAAIAGVTFLPPRTLAAAAGGTLIERARGIAVRAHEKALRQTLTAVEVVPFESSRPGTWLLKASPVAKPDGQRVKFPLHVIVELGTNAIAEVNVHGTGDDDSMARRIIESIRTSTSDECYLPELELLFKAIDVATPIPPSGAELAYITAARQAQSDVGNPVYRTWYENQMRPAFNHFFGAALNQCTARAGSSGALSLGLVLTVDTSGAVTGVTWREDTGINRCLDPLIRQQRFPPPPQTAFHFGVESNP